MFDLCPTLPTSQPLIYFPQVRSIERSGRRDEWCEDPGSPKDVIFDLWSMFWSLTLSAGSSKAGIHCLVPATLPCKLIGSFAIRKCRPETFIHTCVNIIIKKIIKYTASCRTFSANWAVQRNKIPSCNTYHVSYTPTNPLVLTAAVHLNWTMNTSITCRCRQNEETSSSLFILIPSAYSSPSLIRLSNKNTAVRLSSL